MSEIYGKLGALMGGMFIIGILGIAVAIFSIVCMWRVYEKMEIPGWASIIPGYNQWVLCEAVWGNAIISLAIIIPVILSNFIDNNAIVLVCSLISSVVTCVTNWKMYKGFGKSTLFCIFGLFVSPITTAICAFDDSSFYRN